MGLSTRPTEASTSTCLWTRNACECVFYPLRIRVYLTKEVPSRYRAYEYKSVFFEKITDYISTRRKEGFMYDNPAYWLSRFDQFCCSNKIQAVFISKQFFDAWASRNESETKTTQCNRLEALKNFSVEYVF